jgi:dihydroneopterin aldolase
MITISLHGAEFFAFHGFYPEEQKLGNRFMVDVEVSFEPVVELNADQISDTVDYEQLYDLVSEQMSLTKKLIETVAQAIADSIKDRFSFVKNIRVCIKKLNPALKGEVEYSGVVITI